MLFVEGINFLFFSYHHHSQQICLPSHLPGRNYQGYVPSPAQIPSLWGLAVVTADGSG